MLRAVSVRVARGGRQALLTLLLLAVPAALAAQERRPLTLEDYGAWNRITQVALSADGAVDWNHGLELYTAARRMGKEVILLSYPDEPHHLAKEANQQDFQARMRQWFDHWLRGATAPEWMEGGVPFLQKGKKGPT